MQVNSLLWSIAPSAENVPIKCLKECQLRWISPDSCRLVSDLIYHQGGVFSFERQAPWSWPERSRTRCPWRHRGKTIGQLLLPLASLNHWPCGQSLWGRGVLSLPQSSNALSIPTSWGEVPHQDLPSQCQPARGHWHRLNPARQLGLRPHPDQGAHLHPVLVDRPLLRRLHGARGWPAVQGGQGHFQCRGSRVDLALCYARCPTSQWCWC